MHGTYEGSCAIPDARGDEGMPHWDLALSVSMMRVWASPVCQNTKTFSARDGEFGDVWTLNPSRRRNPAKPGMVPADPRHGGQADLTLAAQGSRHGLEHAGLGGWPMGRAGKGGGGGQREPKRRDQSIRAIDQPTNAFAMLACARSGFQLLAIEFTSTRGWPGDRLPVGHLLPQLSSSLV
jgi:hypothetical protein